MRMVSGLYTNPAVSRMAWAGKYSALKYSWLSYESTPSMTNFGMLSMRLYMNSATNSGKHCLKRGRDARQAGPPRLRRLEQRERQREEQKRRNGDDGHDDACDW